MYQPLPNSMLVFYIHYSAVLYTIYLYTHSWHFQMYTFARHLHKRKQCCLLVLSWDIITALSVHKLITYDTCVMCTIQCNMLTFDLAVECKHRHRVTKVNEQYRQGNCKSWKTEQNFSRNSLQRERVWGKERHKCVRDWFFSSFIRA